MTVSETERSCINAAVTGTKTMVLATNTGAADQACDYSSTDPFVLNPKRVVLHTSAEEHDRTSKHGKLCIEEANKPWLPDSCLR